MKYTDERSELLLPSTVKGRSLWKYLALAVLTILIASSFFAKTSANSNFEDSVGGKVACKESDCTGCTRKPHRRNLAGEPGSGPTCKDCCAQLLALVKGESVLQVVPRNAAQQAQQAGPYGSLENFPRPPSSGYSGGDENRGFQSSPLSDSTIDEESAHRGTEFAQFVPPGKKPVSVTSPGAGSSMGGASIPAPPGSRPRPMSVKISIDEKAQLPSQGMQDTGTGPPTGNENYMDVFLVRHGESTANEIKEKAKKGELQRVAYGRKVFAKDLYDGCNQNPLPYGIYPLDCTELLQDARLTEKGLRDAELLFENWQRWAVASGRPMVYEPADAAVLVSPLRRSAVTGLMSFKNVLDKIHVEVEFDFRELQYTLRNGLFAENQCMNYPQSLKDYVEEVGLTGPTFHYHEERMVREGHVPGEKFVTQIWESDEEHPLAPGCPKNIKHFQNAIQRAVEYAQRYGRKYVVVGTHSYVIKCANREFSLSQTNDKPDPLNPYYKFGGYLLENGAVQRIVWDLKNKHVVGPPKMVWKGVSKEKYFNRFYWPTPPATPGRSPQLSPLESAAAPAMAGLGGKSPKAPVKED